MKTEKELREAWNKVFKPVPMRKDGACLYCGIKPEVIADWWLSHRQAELDELVGKLEGERITEKKGIAEMIFGDGHKENIRMHTNMDFGYNLALDKAIKIIKGKK